MNTYKDTFEKETVKKVQEALGLKNVMAVPRIKKIVVNTSTRDFLVDKKNLEKAAEDFEKFKQEYMKLLEYDRMKITFNVKK